jgi:hypothetical protein
MKVCTDCGSTDVYEIEFRTDYSYASSIGPINEPKYHGKYVTNDDLPYRLYGCYCHGCRSLCSTIESK